MKNSAGGVPLRATRQSLRSPVACQREHGDGCEAYPRRNDGGM